MPPKKTSSKLLSSPDAPDKNEKAEENEPGVVSADAVSSRKVAAHPPTMTMVKEALKELNSKKGTSSQAIRKYILEKHPSVDTVRLKYMLRKALLKGMESGVLVRPANSTLTTGAHGKFRLAPKTKEPKLKTAENTDPNAPKATSKAGAKKPKATATGGGAEKEKAAVEKKKASVKKQDKSSEDSKPAKKAKAVKGAAASKVAPAKKPKDKKVAEEGEEALDAAKASTSKAAKGSKKKDDDKAPATKAAGKRGKKTD